MKLDSTLDATTDGTNDTRVLELRDLVGSEIDIGTGTELRVGDVIPFVVLKYEVGVDKAWGVPSLGLFRSLLNRVTTYIYEHNLDFSGPTDGARSGAKLAFLA